MDKNNIINNVLKSAENEMKKLNHPYVGTEHLILSLLKRKEIKEIVDDYGLNYEIFLGELVNIIGVSSIKSSTILYTPLLKSVIKDATEDAKENNNSIVTLKHLFISVLESGDGIAVRILINMGIDLEGIYKDLKNDFKLFSNELDKYGKDLTLSNTKLIGRNDELNQIVEILLRKNKNNPLLIGDAGVGKTAIVEGLSLKIKEGFYKKLEGYKIFSLDLSLVLAGTKYRGDFEERLNNIIKEVISLKKVILFIDEIHTLTNAGGSEGAIDAANILKPYLSKNTIKIIGATTRDEYKKYLSVDKALVRRFDVVNINEPNREMTRDILYKLKSFYSNYHNVKITNKNLDYIIDKNDTFLIDKKNPDKSLDILDSVCSYVANKEQEKILDSDIDTIIMRKNNRKLKLEREKVLSLIKNQVFGQDNVINNILDIIENTNNFLSILLIGGVGVGKTSVIKEISKYEEANFIFINETDFSQFNNELYNKLNNNSIILFDNIEKYNKYAMDEVLHILEDKCYKDKMLNNSIIFLSATNLVKYNIGYNSGLDSILYKNEMLENKIDYRIVFNDINEDVINAYITNNNIKNFDISKCDYKMYGFRGVKISINSSK